MKKLLIILFIAFLIFQCNVVSNGNGKFLINNITAADENTKTNDNNIKTTGNNITINDNSTSTKNTVPQWDGETTVTNLKFSSIQSEKPDIQKKWMIKNPNPFSVEVKWEIYPNIQTSSILAIPGDTYFYTDTIKGSNTTKIYWIDQNCIVHNIVKTSIDSLK